jgi:transaldolase/glucose-6-phosphate isomerase
MSPGSLGAAVDAAVVSLTKESFASRLWLCDPTLFGNSEERTRVVANRLGWIHSPSWLTSRVDELEDFAAEIRSDGFKHAVLLGMGGSSLCPEVLSRVFGLAGGLESFAIVDTTDPAALMRVAGAVALEHTLFLVASKSGSTIETRSQAEYFFDLLKSEGLAAGRQFVAITDSGSALEKWGTEGSFRRIFINPSDIGGRYSALSYFGMVAGAVLGIPLRELARIAVEQSDLLKPDVHVNPALMLGAVMGAAAKAGMDKLTFVATDGLQPVVPWIEQLVAESTGKEGLGVVPIEAESPGSLEDYGTDRLFCLLRLTDLEVPATAYQTILDSDRPWVEVVVSDRASLGALFLLWEYATSAAGKILNINPYDEPNVKESKDNTARLLEQYTRNGALATEPVTVSTAKFDLTTRVAGQDTDCVLSSFLQGVGDGDYISWLYFGDYTARVESTLGEMRLDGRGATGAATLRGYGPRYLHSIGQLYKGGAQRGHFIVFMREIESDRTIPGAAFSFGTLLGAQALGDYQALAKRDRPALFVQLKGEPQGALAEFAAAWRAATAQISV